MFPHGYLTGTADSYYPRVVKGFANGKCSLIGKLIYRLVRSVFNCQSVGWSRGRYSFVGQ